MAFPSISFLWSRLIFFFTPPKGAPTPLLSTPGAPECHAVPQVTKCGANRAHGQVRGLGLEERGTRKAGAKTQDLGPGPKAEGGAATEQVHGAYTYAKPANKRLSYCRWRCLPNLHMRYACPGAGAERPRGCKRLTPPSCWRYGSGNPMYTGLPPLGCVWEPRPPVVSAYRAW
jgi:hypothetical protein